MLADTTQKDVTRYIVNPEFNRACLFFSDSSWLEFEHTSRSNRWARASADATTADRVCQSLHHFRLNAKHLQLFFEDGSNLEFRAADCTDYTDGDLGRTPNSSNPDQC